MQLNNWTTEQLKIATNESSKEEGVNTTNQEELDIATIHNELDTINGELDDILESMSENQVSPVQKYIMDNVTQVLKHQIQPNGKLYFQVAFNTNEFGGIRWMAAGCLRYRPHLVVSYWNELVLQAYRDHESQRRILEMETTVFGIYDF